MVALLVNDLLFSYKLHKAHDLNLYLWKNDHTLPVWDLWLCMRLANIRNVKGAYAEPSLCCTAR